MSLLPDSASYHELVQDCFLAFRGAGLMLSPLDAELVDTWADQGVPVEVVARGIRRAAEAALFDAREGVPAMRSLRACKREVEAEIRKHRGKSAGRGPAEDDAGAQPPDEPVHKRRHGKLKAALRKISREVPALASGADRLVRGLLSHEPADLAEAERHEQTADLLLVRALPFEQRVSLLREARQLAHEAGGVSRRARKIARYFHRAALLRRRLNLPPHW